MANATPNLVKKLGIKPGQTVLVLNAPVDYAAQLGEVPPGTQVVTEANGAADVVQAFVYNKADIDQLFPQAQAALKPGGSLWMMYPKKSGSIRTDISRDAGWEVVAAADWHGVTQIALDATWSALRFRPRHEIKKMTRSFGATEKAE